MNEYGLYSVAGRMARVRQVGDVVNMFTAPATTCRAERWEIAGV